MKRVRIPHRLPRVGISRCLLGDDVRYDGGHRRDPVIEALAGRVEWVAVCPEVEVGMGVPREPIRLVAASAAGVRLLGVESGRDWTAAMEAWARARIRELADLRLSGFVLKARSPSCGLRDVPVAGGYATAPDRPAGRGLFAQLLTEAMPDLPVEDEDALRDPKVLDTFVARVAARHQRHLSARPSTTPG